MLTIIQGILFIIFVVGLISGVYLFVGHIKEMFRSGDRLKEITANIHIARLGLWESYEFREFRYRIRLKK